MSDISFKNFAGEYFDKYLKLNPQAGSHLGMHQYDGIIPPVNEDYIQEEFSVYQELYRNLNQINRNNLTKEESFDFDLCKWSLEAIIFEFNEIQAHKTDPMFYVSMFGGLLNYIKRDYAPFDKRLESVNKVLGKIPGILETAEINLNKSLPEMLCKYAILFSKGYEDFLCNDLNKLVKQKSKDQKLISEFSEKSKTAVEAFKKYIEFLNKAGSSDNEDYRYGKNKFEKMLKIKEHIDLPLEEIKKKGYEELSRLQTELNKLIEANNFQNKIRTLEEDHPSSESLLADTKNTLDSLVDFIRKKQIVDLPEKLNCIVTEMPEFFRIGFAAMDTAGPFEKSDESFYYVSLPEKDWDEKKKNEWLTQFNYPTLKLISIHEAYPGHYTHFLNAYKNSTLLSKLFMSYSYIEGWAHYTEEMMIEEGYDKNDFKSKIGMLIEALIRCCRYIVAIGIHCENMSIEDAKNIFITNAYMPESTACSEAERGAFDPGYLSYTLGKLYMKEFREKYLTKFKDKSLKDFHNTVVSLGAPTFKIAEDYILN